MVDNIVNGIPSLSGRMFQLHRWTWSVAVRDLSRASPRRWHGGQSRPSASPSRGPSPQLWNSIVLVIAEVSPLKVPCCKSFFIKLNTIYINLIFYVEVSGETLGRHKSGTDTK